MQTLQQQIKAEMERDRPNQPRPNPSSPALSANKNNCVVNWPDSSAEHDPFEDDEFELPLTEAQAAWSGVISRLGLDKPHSKYANLSADELIEMARVWAQTLRDVPLHAISELYDRVMQHQAREMANGKSVFPPDATTFSAVWRDPAWDFWAEANRNDEANAIVFRALPEAPPEANGPGGRTSRAQMKALRERGAMVTCQCRNDCGIAVPAMLDERDEFWLCSLKRCGFRWPKGRTNEAPVAERPRPKPRGQVSEAKRHPAADAPTWLHDMARDCGYQLENLLDEEFLGFSMWAKWFKDRYSCRASAELMDETWPIWEAERRG